jgi:virulence-associated protein VapD
MKNIHQCQGSSYGAKRTVRGAIHVLSVQPVLQRVESAAVDVSDRRNPVTSSRIVILAHRVPFLVA